eukprot:10401688-Prorocentrum_lima.AAC.1
MMDLKAANKCSHWTTSSASGTVQAKTHNKSKVSVLKRATELSEAFLVPCKRGTGSQHLLQQGA